MMNRLALGLLAFAAANGAWAGTRLGAPLGRQLGSVLGLRLDEMFPLLGGGLLMVAGASLAIGIYVARRKQKR